MADEYFYGRESDQFSFYRIPKIFYEHEKLKCISEEAKLLYGILLDRMSLSAKNGWMDKEGRVYIIYTIDEVRDILNCGNQKAVKLLDELEKASLIERKRQGLNRPNLIYVKNFISVAGSHFRKCEKYISGNVKNTFQEVSESHGNNTDKSNTDKNNTDPFPSFSVNEGKDGSDAVHDFFYERLQIGYLKNQHRDECDRIDEILELIADACRTEEEYIRIGGEKKTASIVRSRFMKLGYDHIEFVLSCMNDNTTRIRNIRQYLLTVLYNAPATISNYYSALVSHDMNGS